MVTTYADGFIIPAKPGNRTQPRVDMSGAQPFKIDGVYCRLIPLTQGQFSIVNEDDYEHLSRMRWCAWWNPKTKTYYAVTRLTQVDGKSTTIHMHCYLSPLAERVDHRNLCSLDNRRDNIRKCSHGQNMHNRGAQANNHTGYKGVS